MSKHKVKKIAIPIYFGWLFIVFSDDFNKTIKELKLDTEGRDDLHLFGAIVFQARNKKGVSKYTMLFDKKPSHGEIAHETVHVVNAIYMDRRITLDPLNDEPQAYLTGWITSEVYKALELI